MEPEEVIISELVKKNYTVTTAESCTGGLLAGTILNVPGASKAYREGYITYSDEAKERLLGVSRDTLAKYGAVSAETAGEMADGAAKAAGADVSLSTTGIAGPGGGSPDKPVGLIYVGCRVRGKTSVRKCLFRGDRQENRMSAVRSALELAVQMLTAQDFKQYI